MASALGGVLFAPATTPLVLALVGAALAALAARWAPAWASRLTSVWLGLHLVVGCLLALGGVTRSPAATIQFETAGQPVCLAFAIDGLAAPMLIAASLALFVLWLTRDAAELTPTDGPVWLLALAGVDAVVSSAAPAALIAATLFALAGLTGLNVASRDVARHAATPMWLATYWTIGVALATAALLLAPSALVNTIGFDAFRLGQGAWAEYRWWFAWLAALGFAGVAPAHGWRQRHFVSTRPGALAALESGVTVVGATWLVRVAVATFGGSSTVGGPPSDLTEVGALLWTYGAGIGVGWALWRVVRAENLAPTVAAAGAAQLALAALTAFSPGLAFVAATEPARLGAGVTMVALFLAILNVLLGAATVLAGAYLLGVSRREWVGSIARWRPPLAGLGWIIGLLGVGGLAGAPPTPGGAATGLAIGSLLSAGRAPWALVVAVGVIALSAKLGWALARRELPSADAAPVTKRDLALAATLAAVISVGLVGWGAWLMRIMTESGDPGGLIPAFGVSLTDAAARSGYVAAGLTAVKLSPLAGIGALAALAAVGWFAWRPVAVVGDDAEATRPWTPEPQFEPEPRLADLATVALPVVEPPPARFGVAVAGDPPPSRAGSGIDVAPVAEIYDPDAAEAAVAAATRLTTPPRDVSAATTAPAPSRETDDLPAVAWPTAPGWWRPDWRIEAPDPVRALGWLVMLIARGVAGVFDYLLGRFAR